MDRIVSSPSKAARGIRNKNPGNLRDFGIPWEGIEGRDAEGYAVFARMQDGVRAMALDVLSDYGKKRQRTPRLLVTEYAPPSENDTANYIAFVAKAMGVGPDDDLGLRAPDGRVSIERLKLLLRTKIRMECAPDHDLVTGSEFEAGVLRAITRVPVIAA